MVIVQRYVHSGFVSGDYSNGHSNRYVVVEASNTSNHRHYTENGLTLTRRLLKEEGLTHPSWHVRKIAAEVL